MKIAYQEEDRLWNEWYNVIWVCLFYGGSGTKRYELFAYFSLFFRQFAGFIDETDAGRLAVPFL
ncbi:hypothetical protein [Paenibacillus glycanilyticus]|uniref:Uncharacterized protein n=1 Tax=Paenibacillus glycanilyticus TaxID=126569 RepID=A0ABQ6NFG5_9BACL|nr:hypothetical protein [Paenibacillus glycanilyticus]MCK9857532.1 hypothetical protein [Paenibacillus sp. ATY16]GMK43856.1 hypothetical protein PghCCS26_09830 [Paenibacillus glycanilyticus]